MTKLFRFTLLWLALVLISVSTSVAWAGDAVIWNSALFGRFLPSAGLQLNDLKQYRTLSVDPSAGGGVVAPIGSVGVRDNAGAGEMWVKAAAGNTAWTNVLTGLTGWSLTGNTGTNDAINFLGTTDAQDLVIKTNNANRMVISDVGRFDLYPSTDGLFVDANVAATVDYNHLYMGANMTGAVSNNFYGPVLQPDFSASVAGAYFGFSDFSGWQAATVVPQYNSIVISPNFQAGSSVTNGISALQFNANIPAGVLNTANINGISMNPVVNSDLTGYNGFIDAPSINGAIGGYNGYSLSTSFGAASNMASIFKGINIQPNVAAGATFPSGNAIFVGGNVAAGVTINDWTDIQASSDVDAAINTYSSLNTNPQGSGNITSATLINVGANLSGNNTGVTGVNVTGTIGNNVTNATGINVATTVTGTATNVTGISVNNSGLTSPNQKIGVQVSDGALSVSSNYDTSVLSTNPGFGQLNGVGGNFTVAAGFPVTGGATMTGVNLGSIFDFQDDMPVDFTGGIIGASQVGFLTQLGVAATKTVDHMNFMVAGAQVAAGSTGGTVTSLDFYSAAGILPSAGTLLAGEIVGFHARSTLCAISPTACYGIKIDDPLARNYFTGGVELAPSAAQPACSATIRGTLWVIQGGAGVADQYEICQKDSADVYSWLDVGSGALSDYLYKPGLAGGQTATGGTAASENLVLRSTTNGTKGQVYLDETTASTSPTTGALRVDGGVGVGGQLSAAGAVRSDTSLILSDPGAGTNTVTLQAGVVSGSYSVTLPLAQATAGQQALVNDGTGVTSWQSLTPQLFGTRQTGRSIVAGTGITAAASHMSTTVFKQLIFVVGASGGTDITASPQIEAGTIIGQEMELCGTSDADWVLLETDNNLRLNGQAELRKDTCLTLVWRGTDGTNAAWGEKARTF